MHLTLLQHFLHRSSAFVEALSLFCSLFVSLFVYIVHNIVACLLHCENLEYIGCILLLLISALVSRKFGIDLAKWNSIK